jgi:hypothetical protein
MAGGKSPRTLPARPCKQARQSVKSNASLKEFLYTLMARWVLSPSRLEAEGMPPMNEPKAECADLAERLRAISIVLWHIPLDHPVSHKSLDHLSKELADIAARLRGDPLPRKEDCGQAEKAPAADPVNSLANIS